MSFASLLGKVRSLPIVRFGPPGAFLAIDPQDTSPRSQVVLLPGAEIPDDAKEGDELSVFLTLDSEDRPLASTVLPHVVLGEVAFLEAVDVVSFGAFFDWGLPKQLLVPHKEQTRDVRVGDRHPVGLFVDDTGRLAGTMRVTEMLHDRGDFSPGQWVQGEAWRKEPGVGVFVLVEKQFVGVVPEHDPSVLERGQAASFRVTRVLADGKIELSPRPLAKDALDGDGETILRVLARPGAPRIGDKSSPELLHSTFGLSKKAFKRALGRLLREGKVSLDAEGVAKLGAAPR